MFVNHSQFPRYLPQIKPTKNKWWFLRWWSSKGEVIFTTLKLDKWSASFVNGLGRARSNWKFWKKNLKLIQCGTKSEYSKWSNWPSLQRPKFTSGAGTRSVDSTVKRLQKFYVNLRTRLTSWSHTTFHRIFSKFRIFAPKNYPKKKNISNFLTLLEALDSSEILLRALPGGEVEDDGTHRNRKPKSLTSTTQTQAMISWAITSTTEFNKIASSNESK